MGCTEKECVVSVQATNGMYRRRMCCQCTSHKLDVQKKNVLLVYKPQTGCTEEECVVSVQATNGMYRIKNVFRRVNLRLNPQKIDTKGFLTEFGRFCHVK